MILPPDDHRAWHPLARVSAFVGLAVVAPAVVTALVYDLVSAALRAAGLRPQLADWLPLAGTWAATVLLVRWAEPRGARATVLIALDAPAWRPRVLASGLGIALAPLVVGTAMLLALGAYAVAPGTGGSHADLVVRAALVLVPAALHEELLFRGYAYRVLRDWRGARTAIGASAVVFAALHAPNPGATVESLSAVALAGAFLGILRERTGSLAAVFVGHAAWNAAQVVVAHAPVSGIAFDTPGWRLVPDGPAWLTGGGWGLEAAFPVVLLLTVTTASLALAGAAPLGLSPLPAATRRLPP